MRRGLEARTDLPFTSFNLPLTAAPWTVLLIAPADCRGSASAAATAATRGSLFWLLLTRAGLLFGADEENRISCRDAAQTLVIAAPIAAALRHEDPTPAIGFLFRPPHAVAAGVSVCIVLFLVLRLDSVTLGTPGPILGRARSAILCSSARGRFRRPSSHSHVFLLTALGFALALHGAEAWIIPDFDNRAPTSFAAVVVESTRNSPLYLIGDGIRGRRALLPRRTVSVLASPDSSAGLQRLRNRLGRPDARGARAGTQRPGRRIVGQVFAEGPTGPDEISPGIPATEAAGTVDARLANRRTSDRVALVHRRIPRHPGARIATRWREATSSRR